MDITLPLERANKPRLTNGHRSAKAIDDNHMDQHEEFPLLFFLPTADDDASAIFPFYIWRAFPLYMRIFFGSDSATFRHFEHVCRIRAQNDNEQALAVFHLFSIHTIGNFPITSAHYASGIRFLAS